MTMNSLSAPALWSKLSAKEFEMLISWMLYREGFFNISWLRKRDPDGRAIYCQRTEMTGAEIKVKTYIVQCRQHKAKVARKALQNDLKEHISYMPDHVVVATSGIVGEKSKKWCQDLPPGPGIVPVIWERSDLVILLRNHQDLGLQLFGVPPSPDFYVRHLNDRELQFIDLNRLFQSPEVKDYFVRACTIALEKSTLVTLAHLLISLMRLDEKYTIKMLQAEDLDPNEIAGYLETLVDRSQNKVDLKLVGLKLSSSFRSVLDTAVIITRLFDNQVLTERILLLAILMHPTSVSVDALNQLCGKDEQVILSALLDNHFNDKECSILLGAFGQQLEALGTKEVRALWERFGATEDSEAGLEETATFTVPDLASLRGQF